MFRCQIGNHITKPYARQIKVVVETRDKAYASRKLDGDRWDGGGKGKEIVREIYACQEHANVAKLEALRTKA